MMKSVFSSTVAETVVLLASHSLSAQAFHKFWNRVSPKLEEGVSYLEAHDAENVSQRKTFLEVVTMRDAKLTRIINQCLKDFLTSDLLALMAQVQRMQDTIAARKERINAWRLALVSAPATSLNPLRVTRAKLYRRMKKEQAGIEHDTVQMEAIKAQTLEQLTHQGIRLTSEQLNGLLYTAEGLQIAQVMAVAENIKRIQASLAENLQREGGNGDLVKHYTGFLMMSYRVYLEIIDRAIHTIRKDYLPRLESLFDKANDQILCAKQLYVASKRQNTIAKNNMDLNAQTLSLINLYRTHLKGRLEALMRLQKDMTTNYQVSVNTFRTIKVGSELIDVINACDKDIQSIFAFEAPELAAIYDDGLKAQFEIITAQLKGSTP